MITKIKIKCATGSLLIEQRKFTITFDHRGITKKMVIDSTSLKRLIKQGEESVKKSKTNKDFKIGFLKEHDVSLRVTSNSFRVALLNKPGVEDVLYFDLKELKNALALFEDEY